MREKHIKNFGHFYLQYSSLLLAVLFIYFIYSKPTDHVFGLSQFMQMQYLFIGSPF
jgi:hypothetical protein